MKKYTAIMMLVCLGAGMAFGDVWQDLARYEYGKGNAADEADKLLEKTPVDQHGAIEDALIVVVSDKNATQDGKAFACRMLQQIGTEKCIPAVAALLSDEVLSHYARLVLERLGTPKADEAMRKALNTAPDKLKIGIMGSLGATRDAKAVKQIAKFAVSSDPAVAYAAIGALGRIGGSSAASSLRKLKPAESLGPVYMCALLDCAHSLKGSAAMSLYEMVLAGKTSQRLGALSGMLSADEKKAVALMLGFLKGDDAYMTSGVLTLVCNEKIEPLTKAMVKVLGTLPDEKKAALITALGARGDKAALGSVTGYLASPNEGVRNAAMMAVSKLGDDESVKLLLAMSGGATEAIARMPGSGVNEVLIKSLDEKKLTEAAIRALVARNCLAGVPALLNLLNDSDVEVRKAAWNGLGSLATGDDMVPMAKALFATKDGGELGTGMAAVRNVCAHAGDKAKCFEVIVAYYDGTTDAAKSAIVDLAAMVGSPAALEVVNKAMNSGNPELYASAVRSLAEWSNASAAAELLNLAKGAPKVTDRIVALRGYVRLAGMDNVGLNPTQRTGMFKQAAELATRPEEQKLIIGGLRTVRNAETLALVNKYLDDPAVREDAEQSAAEMSWEMRKQGPAAEVKDVATKLLTSKNPGIVDRAKQTLADMSK